MIEHVLTQMLPNAQVSRLHVSPGMAHNVLLHQAASARIVATMRHPFNTLISSMLTTEFTGADAHSVRQQINNASTVAWQRVILRYIQYGGAAAAQLCAAHDLSERSTVSPGKVLVLKYEIFSGTELQLINAMEQIERFLGCALSNATKYAIAQKESVGSIEQYLGQRFRGDAAFLGAVDRSTGLHPHHIGVFHGATDYRSLLSPEVIALIARLDTGTLRYLTERFYPDTAWPTRPPLAEVQRQTLGVGTQEVERGVCGCSWASKRGRCHATRSDFTRCWFFCCNVSVPRSAGTLSIVTRDG